MEVESEEESEVKPIKKSKTVKKEKPKVETKSKKRSASCGK